MTIHPLPPFADPARYWSATWEQPATTIVAEHELGSRRVRIACYGGPDQNTVICRIRHGHEAVTLTPGSIDTGTSWLDLTPENLSHAFPLTVIVTA